MQIVTEKFVMVISFQVLYFDCFKADFIHTFYTILFFSMTTLFLYLRSKKTWNPEKSSNLTVTH